MEEERQNQNSESMSRTSSSAVQNGISNAQKNVANATSQKNLKARVFTKLAPMLGPIIFWATVVIIAIVVLVGIGTFLMTTPGLLMDKLKELSKAIGNSILSAWGYDTTKMVDDEAVYNVLDYLERMNYDLKGYGFLSGYTYEVGNDDDGENKYVFEDVDVEDKGSGETNKSKLAKINPNYSMPIDDESDGVVRYTKADEEADSKHREGKIKDAKSTYVFMYLASDNYVYTLKNDNWVYQNESYTGFWGRLAAVFKGIAVNLVHIRANICDLLLGTHISGIGAEIWGKGLVMFYYEDGFGKKGAAFDDSISNSIDIDTDSKKLIIDHAEGFAWSNKSRLEYDVDGWVGRYGMPLDFLLSVHVATMMPDLAYDMVQYFPTNVNVYLHYVSDTEVTTEDGGKKSVATYIPYVASVTDHWYRNVYFVEPEDKNTQFVQVDAEYESLVKERWTMYETYTEAEAAGYGAENLAGEYKLYGLKENGEYATKKGEVKNGDKQPDKLKEVTTDDGRSYVLFVGTAAEANPTITIMKGDEPGVADNGDINAKIESVEDRRIPVAKKAITLSFDEMMSQDGNTSDESPSNNQSKEEINNQEKEQIENQSEILPDTTSEQEKKSIAENAADQAVAYWNKMSKDKPTWESSDFAGFVLEEYQSLEGMFRGGMIDEDTGELIGGEGDFERYISKQVISEVMNSALNPDVIESKIKLAVKTGENINVENSSTLLYRIFALYAKTNKRTIDERGGHEYDESRDKNDYEWYNTDGVWTAYKLSESGTITQTGEGLRTETNPLIKRMFLINTYFRYDGTKDTADAIHQLKEAYDIKEGALDLAAAEKKIPLDELLRYSTQLRDEEGNDRGDPISIDDLSGQVALSQDSLNAFSMLENTHTLDADYIYRDFKELVVELGYFTKEELTESIPRVFAWPLPTVGSYQYAFKELDKKVNKFGTMIHSKGDIDAYKLYKSREESEATSNNNEEDLQSNSINGESDSSAYVLDDEGNRYYINPDTGQIYNIFQFLYNSYEKTDWFNFFLGDWIDGYYLQIPCGDSEEDYVNIDVVTDDEAKKYYVVDDFGNKYEIDYDEAKRSGTFKIENYSAFVNNTKKMKNLKIKIEKGEDEKNYITLAGQKIEVEGSINEKERASKPNKKTTTEGSSREVSKVTNGSKTLISNNLQKVRKKDQNGKEYEILNLQGKKTNYLDGNKGQGEGGTYKRENIVETGKACWDYIVQNRDRYTYAGAAIPITGGSTVDCSSFASWILYEYGYSDFGGWQHVTQQFLATDWNALYGWEEISVGDTEDATPKLQPGDFFVRDHGSNDGHITFVYSTEGGNLKLLDCGSSSYWKTPGNEDGIPSGGFVQGTTGRGQGKIIRVENYSPTKKREDAEKYEGYNGNDAVVSPATGILLDYGTYDDSEEKKNERKNADISDNSLDQSIRIDGVDDVVNDTETGMEKGCVDKVGYAKILVLDAKNYKLLETYTNNKFKNEKHSLLKDNYEEDGLNQKFHDEYIKNTDEVDDLDEISKTVYGYKEFAELYEKTGVAGNIIYIDGFRCEDVEKLKTSENKAEEISDEDKENNEDEDDNKDSTENREVSQRSRYHDASLDDISSTGSKDKISEKIPSGDPITFDDFKVSESEVEDNDKKRPSLYVDDKDYHSIDKNTTDRLDAEKKVKSLAAPSLFVNANGKELVFIKEGTVLGRTITDKELQEADYFRNGKLGTYDDVRKAKDDNGDVVSKVIGNYLRLIMRNKEDDTVIENVEDYLILADGQDDQKNKSQQFESFSITGTMFDENEWVEITKAYIEGHYKGSSFDTKVDLNEFYKICVGKHVNPEFAFVRAIQESSLSSPNGNYWGMGTPNGASLASYGGWKNTLNAYCDQLNKYQTPGTYGYQAIMTRYQERKACTENGGCDPNGFGTPDTAQGIQSVYSWLGNDHLANSAGGGGMYYIYPWGWCGDFNQYTGENKIIYENVDEFNRLCGGPHNTPGGSTSSHPTSTWEQARYTAWQVEKIIKIAKDVYGEKAGTYAGG